MDSSDEQCDISEMDGKEIESNIKEYIEQISDMDTEDIDWSDPEEMLSDVDGSDIEFNDPCDPSDDSSTFNRDTGLDEGIIKE